MLRHVGDIAASWALQVGIRAGILESFRWFYDENIVLVPPVRGLVEVSQGVEL